MDEDSCMADIAKFFLEFTVSESCGSVHLAELELRGCLRNTNENPRGKVRWKTLKSSRNWLTLFKPTR